MKHIKKYIAEALGTFILSFAVILVGLFLAGPQGTVIGGLFAGTVLAYLVFTLGPISGGHFNPAITIGALSIKKIHHKDAMYFIIAQFIGAIIAFGLSGYLVAGTVSGLKFGKEIIRGQVIGEIIGTFIFAFGVASLMYGRVEKTISGIIVGASLFIGIIIAYITGSDAVLNPAVALATNTFGFTYLLAPVIGSVMGMLTYSYFTKE